MVASRNNIVEKLPNSSYGARRQSTEAAMRRLPAGVAWEVGFQGVIGKWLVGE